MVVLSPSSLWGKPAPHLVYMESGGGQIFPPPKNKNLPRAITFENYARRPSDSTPAEPEMLKCQILKFNKTDCTEDNVSSLAHSGYLQDHPSVLVTSNTNMMEIEDPPEAYQSFEDECFREPVSQLESEISWYEDLPSISTPNEQYLKSLKQKRSMHYHYGSEKPMTSPTLPSGSNSCIVSPLIHTGSSYLSLDELVDLYTKRMDESRRVQVKNADDQLNVNRLQMSSTGSEEIKLKENVGPSLEKADEQKSCLDLCNDSNVPQNANAVLREVSQQNLCENSNNESSNPVQLMVFDIHLLLQKLDNLFESPDEDSVCISLTDLEALVASCGSSTMELSNNSEN